ncbi:MAG TPA: homocysteine S-methyltransferase family protein [Arenicellales bacterium]|nr:homocysteine S-methyltransferase family protein [Arenicellales bacterium]
MYSHVSHKLESGRTVVLDGGTGTEIQRRGAPMDSQAWCAVANLTHADTVRAIHADYIRAGAEVIIANTYASSPLLFSHLGREVEIEAIDRAAVRLAHEAVDEAATAPVAVAGSCSVMPPVAEGADRVPDRVWDPERIRPLYQRKVEVLADAGCDLIIMEMMRDLDTSLWATEAAVATGLPVWVGMSVERIGEAGLVSFANHRFSLPELTRGLMATGAQAALVMHNEISTTGEAIELIESVWSGPVGVYPEAGHFEMPTWVFQDIAPEAFAQEALRWRQAGATILGGCCGITPDHIRAMADALGED